MRKNIYFRDGKDKSIRIDKEVYLKLAELAKGFDTPNQVIRRILKLD